MTEQTRIDATIDEPPPERSVGLRAQFHRDWQEALRSGVEPKIDGYLTAVAEPEKSRLRAEFEKLAHEYRQKRAAANEQTQAEPGATRKSSEQSVTVNEAPDTKVEGNQRTAEYRLEAQTTPADQSGTLDYAPAPVDPDSTLEGDPGAEMDKKDFLLDRKTAAAVAAANQSVAGYEILETLGRGAMGVVYKARQRGLRRVVALKMILAGGHASEIELSRFRIEAEAVGQLQHPNIVQVFEVGEHNGCPFLSLEFVNGDSLQKKLGGAPQAVMPTAQMIQVLAQAMDFAHRKGIIHRDLKPANVLLTLPRTAESGESSTVSMAPLVETLYGTPKIADFGLAKRLEEDGGQTRSGTILGTPSYMSPEQAEGKSKNVGPLADQYALGAILYEMLTGRPPFRGETVWDTLDQVRTQEPVPPSQLQPKVPRDLETVCLKALQKEGAKRYKDCAELAEDLRRFGAGEPILARPVSAPERLWRWCRRNPKMAAITGIAALLLAGVAVLSTVSAILINKEKNRAEQNEKEARDAQAIAAEQASLALDTLKETVTRVQTALQETPAAREVRAEILEMAMERVKKVADVGKRNVGLDMRIMAAAHNQLGGIYLGLDKFPEALRQYQDAYEILDGLAQEHPDSDKARGNLAVALASLGEMKRRMGNTADAHRYYQRALQIREEIHDHPGNGDLPRDEVKRSLAGTYDNLVAVTADLAEARRYREIALNLRKEAVDIAPDSAEAKRDLSKSYSWFGEDRAKEGSVKDALANFDRCLKLAVELVQGNPKKRSFRSDLAHVLARRAEMLLRLDEAKEAQQCYVRVLKEYERLARDDPGNTELQNSIMANRYGLATACLEGGNVKTGLEECRKLLRYWESWLVTYPKDRNAQSWVMLCSARSGDWARATGLAEEFRRQRPKDAGNLVLVAQGYALCVAGIAWAKTETQLTPEDHDRQKQYTSAALAALRQAKAFGFKGWAELQTEPDLAPILKHPDFQALLREVGLKKETTASRK